jgi:multisubunit Na+/H+ antiporter MnhB subunit
LKSIGAVLAGFVAVLGLSIGTDVILVNLGILPPQSEPDSYVWWMLMIALIYRCLYAVAGGYITAALAPWRPMRHVIILGIIGLAFATLGSIVNWNKTTASIAWYPILFIILTLPAVWLGGKLKTRDH